MIRKENGKYIVYSKTTGRKFGTYDTEEAAKKRLRQIEMFKHMKKHAMLPIFLSPQASKALKAKISQNLAKSIIKNPNSVDGPWYGFKDSVRKALTPATKEMTYKDYMILRRI